MAEADSGGNIPAGWDIDNSRDGEGSSNGHTIHIPANENTIGWAAGLPMDSLEPVSGEGEITLTISVDKPLVQAAEVRLRITNNGDNDFTTIEVAPNSVVGMTYDSETGVVKLPVIRDGATKTEYRIRLVRTNDDVPQNVHDVTFTLEQLAGNSLPPGWTIGTAVHVIRVQDNDLTPASPRSPDPFRSPRQETSPANPSGEFQKEANANP